MGTVKDACCKDGDVMRTTLKLVEDKGDDGEDGCGDSRDEYKYSSPYSTLVPKDQQNLCDC